MKLRLLVDSKPALESLTKSSLPINIAWELKKFIKVVNPELASYEELRNQKIIEMGQEIKEDGQKKHRVKNENIKDFAKLMDELLDKEIEVVVPKINIQDLLNYKDVNGKGIEIMTGDLIKLDWLISEEVKN